MKKCALVVLLLSLSLLSAFADPVSLTSESKGLKVFEQNGNRVQDPDGLYNLYSAVTGNENAVFECLLGAFTLGPHSALTVGQEGSEIFLSLITGTVQADNRSDSDVVIYTPVSRLVLCPDSSVNAVSSANYEDFELLSGKACVYDSITGETRDLEVNAIEKALAQSSDYSSLKTESNKSAVAYAELPDIKETSVGKSWNYGVMASIYVPKLNVKITSEDNARRVKESLLNLDYTLGLYFSYNSLKFGFRADSVNTKKSAFDFSGSERIHVSTIKLLGSLIDEICYGSEGTAFYLRADRSTDIDFVHPMVGLMEHIYSDYTNRELGLYTAATTDLFEMTAFADNLSLRDTIKENAGLRFSIAPFKNYDFKAGLSVLATNNPNKFTDFEAFPGADISFKAFHNSKVKGVVRLYSALSVSDIKKFSVGTSLDLNTEHCNANVGIDVSKGAQMSRTVDYGNDAYTIFKEGSTSAVINLYTEADFKFDRYTCAGYLNLPIDISKGLYKDDIIDQNLALKGSAEFGKTSLWAAIRFKNIKFNKPIMDSSEKFSVGADFDFDFSVLSFELGYDKNYDNPVFLSAGFKLAVDRKLLAE